MLKKGRILFITEDFPSGLNGTSVKTRNTLHFFLNLGYKIDLCCFSFEEYKRHDFFHKNLKIFSANVSRYKKNNIRYIIRILKLILTFSPVSIKRLFNENLNKNIKELIEKNSYQTVFFDGYSTLQYLNSSQVNLNKIYIDDEDFTDLFRQRVLGEKNFFKKVYYFHEFIKSLFFEKIKLTRVSQIWAISPNTKKRLSKVSGVKTLLMPTIIPLERNIYKNTDSNIVFTGSLDWRENVEGLKWFVKNHWKEITEKTVNTKLVVIGQGASKELVDFLNSYEGIEYKGYVESLIEEYQKCSLAIAPVRINAGIKVKILTYMSYGLPIVSTKKAAWGLVSTKGVVVSSDKNFAKIILKLLDNSNLRKYLSINSHKNIRYNYSKKVLADFIKENY